MYFRSSRLGVLFWCLASASTVYADVSLSTINVDQTWSPSEGIYTIETGARIYPGVTVTVEPGTQIKFSDGAQLRVDGTLLLNGINNNRINISGATPETSFEGLYIFSGGTITASYVDIVGGTYGINTNGSSSVVTIDSATFDGQYTFPINLGGGTLTVTNSSFSNSDFAGNIDRTATFIHSGNTFNTVVPGWWTSLDTSPDQSRTITGNDGVYYVPLSTIAQRGTLTVEAGVTFYVDHRFPNDPYIQVSGGNLILNGTSSNPVTFYGAGGSCTSTTNTIYLVNQTTNKPTFTANYTVFRDLCGGVSATLANSIAVTDSSFTTISDTVLEVSNAASVALDRVTVTNAVQAFRFNSSTTNPTISASTISTITGSEASIVNDNNTLTIADSTINGASICVDTTQGSTLSIINTKIKQCSAIGIRSQGTNIAPDTISISGSEISESGTGVSLLYALVGTFSGNSFHDNAVGVTINQTPNANMANNWWASTTGPTITTNIGGVGQILEVVNSDGLIYSPWTGADPFPSVSTPSSGGGGSSYIQSEPVVVTAAERSPRDPVIIIPGITGSELYRNYGLKNQIWPNFARALTDNFDTHLAELKLINLKESIKLPIIKGGVILKAPGLKIFDNLIEDLEKVGYREGVDLFLFPYDWRFSNRKNAPLLAEKIDQILVESKKEKVDIIAHSMGGILTKTYIAQSGAEKIDQVFFVGTPHLGAVDSMKTLLQGSNLGFNLIGIPILSKNAVRDLAQTLPSIFELLPSKAYVEQAGPYIFHNNIWLGFDRTKSFIAEQNLSQSMYDDAQALHDELDILNLAQYETYNFVGCGIGKTVTGIKIENNNKYKLLYGTGDETVPIVSASDGNVKQTMYVKNYSHAGLPSVEPVRAVIIELLKGKTISGDGYSDKNCSVSGKAIEIHSPVSLHIYDEDGNHTGPLPDGTIEYGIEGVSYDIIGHEKFAFVPEGGKYRIVNTAEDVGTFDVVISDISEDDEMSNEQVFLDIPVTTMNLMTELRIDDSTDSYIMNIDSDGDGIYDKTLDTKEIPMIKQDEKIEDIPGEQKVQNDIENSDTIVEKEVLVEIQPSELVASTEKLPTKHSLVFIGIVILGLSVFLKNRFYKIK